MKLTRKTLLVSSAALVGSTATSRRAGAQTLTPLNLALVLNDTVTDVLYASRSGIFARAGLNVEWIVANSGAAAAAAVAGGSARFGISSLLTLIEAQDRGIPFTLVAPAGLITRNVPFSQFVVGRDSPLKTGSDLNGKTIGVPALKDLTTAAIMNWVDQNGGDAKTLRFVELPDSAAVPAIEEGRIAGAEINTPTLTRALESGKVRTLAQIFDAIAPRFANTAWFAMDDFATKNADVVTRFGRAMRDSARYCNAHRAQTVPMVAAYLRLDEGFVARMARITFAEVLDPRDLQPLVDLAYKYRMIQTPFDARKMISRYAFKG